MKPKFKLRAFLLGYALISISTVFADTLTWDNGAATGNWNNTDLNWTGVATWNNGTPDDAIFDATGVGTVTLTQAITAGSITFNTAGYTIDTSTFGLTLNTGITANESAIIQSGVGDSLVLGANNAWAVASGKTLTVSSSISGATFGITKSGAGTLTLSGPNTYGGDTTLNGGTVVISNATSLGAGDVFVTANSRINAAALTYANDISIDASRVLTLGTTGAANLVSTFSGAVTGAGSITLAQGVNQSTVINLSSTSNTFTGDIIMPTAAGTNDYIRFASIGDGGSIIFGRASWLAQARYTGAADIEWDTRTISLATTIGISSGLDGGGNPSHMFENTGAGTVTINTAMGVTSTAASTIFFLGGTNTGNNTFAGAIADPTGLNTLGIGKAGTGKWILSNNTNSYQGPVVIHDGTLSVGVIDVAANAQLLGQGSLIQFGYRTANTGTLEYTGAANASTDKQIMLGQADRANNNNFRGGGVILNNGDGTLTFSNPTFNSIAGVSATGTGHVRTLTLGGTNTGANTISGTIRNNNTAIGALLALTKSGAGTWVLEGDNTYTGTTAIQGGVLVAGHANAIAGGLAFDSTGAAITLSGDGILGLGAGDFTRLPEFNATVSAGKITFTSNGGFAAYGADRIVNFGGANGIVAIGSSATAGVIGNMNGKTFILGHATATHKVTVTNTLDFGGGSRTIQVNDGTAAVDAEISGVLQPQAAATNIGLTKTGSGTLLLSNSNTLDGTTAINGGTLIITGATQATSAITFSGGGKLGLDIASSVTASSAVIDFTGQTVLVTGSPTLASYTLLTASSITGTPTLAAPVPGYVLFADGTTLKLNSTGAPAGYAAWQTANSTAGTRDQDHDNDGVDNGTEHFLGGDTNTTGFTPLPGVVNNAGTLSVTWVRHPNYPGFPGNYATDFVVETSTTLTGPWTPESSPGNVIITGNDVKYTFPGGPAYSGKKFARLKVTGP